RSTWPHLREIIAESIIPVVAGQKQKKFMQGLRQTVHSKSDKELQADDNVLQQNHQAHKAAYAQFARQEATAFFANPNDATEQTRFADSIRRIVPQLYGTKIEISDEQMQKILQLLRDDTNR